MNIIISSNFKKHYNTYIDFIDHYWIDYFKLKKMLPHNIVPAYDGMKFYF